MYQKFTGVILKKHPFGEADEMLTIYTREAGKLRAKCRAVRKLGSRFAGHVQTLNEIDFETASSKKTGSTNLPVIVSVRALSVNSYLREDLNKFAWALIGIETLYRLTPDEESNDDLYHELVVFLRKLRSENRNNVLVRSFQLKLVSLAGFGVDLMEFEQTEKDIIAKLLNHNYSVELSKETEKKIERYIETILEREVKSSRFVNDIK